MNALGIIGTVVKEPLVPVEMSLIQFKVRKLQHKKVLALDMEKLKSELNYHKVIGCGLQFGFYQEETLTVNGQHQVILFLISF